MGTESQDTISISYILHTHFIGKATRGLLRHRNGDDRALAALLDAMIFLLLHLGPLAWPSPGAGGASANARRPTTPCPSAKLWLPPAHPIPAGDLERARATKPAAGSPLLAPAATLVSATLNTWMRRNLPASSLRPCSDFGSEGIDSVLTALIDAAHPELDALYRSRRDRRMLRQRSLAAFRAEWRFERSVITNASLHLRPILEEQSRHSKCYEAINIFHHLLTNQTKSAALAAGVVLPLLPDDKQRLRHLRRLQALPLRTGPMGKPLGWHGAPKYLSSAAARAAAEATNTSEYSQECPSNWYPSDWDLDPTFWEGTEWEGSAKPGFPLPEYPCKQRFAGEIAGSFMPRVYQERSPCMMAHIPYSFPESQPGEFSETFQEDAHRDAQHIFEKDDSFVDDAGYVDGARCLEESVCSGGDVNYRIRAVVRKIKVPGSKKIQFSTDPDANVPDRHISTSDVYFHTRTFEAMPGGNSPFGSAKYGGDGTEGLPGPALEVLPGQTINILVRNELGDADTALNASFEGIIEATWKRIQLLNKPHPNGSALDGMGFGSVLYTGPDLGRPVMTGDAVPTADEMKFNEQNTPGQDTNGFNVFNIHTHGLEVQPHLFHPMGTTNPDAPWIGIEPDIMNRSRQCYCYRLTVAESQSPGLFLYHVHRHGTSSMLTWAGMYGLIRVGEHQTPGTSSLLDDVKHMADKEGLAFDESDVLPVLAADTLWRYASVPWGPSQLNGDMSKIPAEDSPDAATVILTDWYPNVRYTGILHPWLVNGDFRPTLHARTQALTLLRLACISASKVW